VRRIQRIGAGVFLALLLVTCTDKNVTGPARYGSAALDLRAFEAGPQPGMPDIPLDSVRVVLRRLPSLDSAAGQVFHLQSDTLAADSFRVASPHDIAALILFSAVGILMATVIETLRRTQARLEIESNDRAALAAERARLIDLEHKARTAAEASNRAKDEFLAMLAHELRTPLSAIATAAHSLERLHGRDAASVPIEVINRQVRHVTRLVDDLLDAGRVMAGKILIDRQPIDLADIIGRSIDALAAARRLERHDLAVHLVPAWVDADADRMEQVIVNLLTNALKYTPPGGSVTVALEHEQANVVLKIEDDGMGIPPELLPRVFDLFVQGARGAYGSPGGLGIGLALVRRLVQLHGGTVDAATRGPGRGSVFTVRLPAVSPPPRESRALVAHAEGG